MKIYRIIFKNNSIIKNDDLGKRLNLLMDDNGKETTIIEGFITVEHGKDKILFNKSSIHSIELM